MTNHDLLCFLLIGFAAGGKGDTDEQGGGANYVCLTQNPLFNQSTPGQDATRSRIFPVEYRSADKGSLNPHHFHDAPCAVCQTMGCRTQVLMIPSSTLCPSRWSKEYSGYLVAARWNLIRTTYVCLDGKPESLPGGDAQAKISYFFPVEIVNSDTTLPSNYETGKELSCAVCTM